MRRYPLFIALAGVLLSAGTAFAAQPVLDNGSTVLEDNPYGGAQVIPDVYQNRGVYGKLSSASSVDIYKFTPDHDGEQTFSLVSRTKKSDSTAQPLLILLDKTTATTDDGLRLPLPAEGYHTAVITATDKDTSYLEPALFQRLSVYATQKIKLTKGTEYYFVAIEPYGNPIEYAIKVGDGRSWTAKDVVTNPGSWIRLQTDSFAGSTPFSFTLTTSAFLLMLLGIIALGGIFILEHLFSLFANRSAAAAQLLVKLQPFSRVIIWISLWFGVIGGYMYFGKVGCVGIPFLLGVLYLILLAVLLYHTFVLSPLIVKQEAMQSEALLPLPLRKRLYVSFVMTLLPLGAIVTLLTMYLIN